MINFVDLTIEDESYRYTICEQAIDLFNSVVTFEGGVIEYGRTKGDMPFVLGHPQSYHLSNYAVSDARDLFELGDISKGLEILHQLAFKYNVEAMKKYVDNCKKYRDYSICIDILKKLSIFNLKYCGEYITYLFNYDNEYSKKEAYSICTSINNPNELIIGMMARANRDGLGTPKNHSKAIDLMSRAALLHPRWIPEAIDLLCLDSHSDYLDQILKICDDEILRKNPAIAFRVGTLYWRGYHYSKDLEKAKECLGIASNGNPNYLPQYIDLLFEIDSEKSLAEAFQICVDHSADSYEILARLGKMYYLGLYVEKDSNLAMDYLMTARKHNVTWVESLINNIL